MGEQGGVQHPSKIQKTGHRTVTTCKQLRREDAIGYHARQDRSPSALLARRAAYSLYCLRCAPTLFTISKSPQVLAEKIAATTCKFSLCISARHISIRN
jgi:hypothetical protein